SERATEWPLLTLGFPVFSHHKGRFWRPRSGHALGITGDRTRHKIWGCVGGGLAQKVEPDQRDLKLSSRSRLVRTRYSVSETALGLRRAEAGRRDRLTSGGGSRSGRF